MIEANHASLSYQDGLSAAASVSFGELHIACVDFYDYCLDYIVTPTSDPLFLFPPSSFLPFDSITYEDLQELYLSSNLSELEENTLVLTVSFSVGELSGVPNPFTEWGREQVFTGSSRVH